MKTPLFFVLIFLYFVFIPSLSLSESDIRTEADINYLNSELRRLEEKKKKLENLLEIINNIQIKQNEYIKIDVDKLNTVEKQLSILKKSEIDKNLLLAVYNNIPYAFGINKDWGSDKGITLFKVVEKLFLTIQLYEKWDYQYQVIEKILKRISENQEELLKKVMFKKDYIAPVLKHLYLDFDIDIEDDELRPIIGIFDDFEDLDRKDDYNKILRIFQNIIINNSVKNQIKIINNIIYEIENIHKTIALKSILLLISDVDDNISLRNDNLREKENKYKEIKINESKKQERIDKLLVWSIYMIIFSAPITLVSLSAMKNKELLGILIKNRTLVEIYSVGLMLAAIIILGTGDKISKEVLGTLLGTIAGYVLARKTQDK